MKEIKKESIIDPIKYKQKYTPSEAEKFLTDRVFNKFRRTADARNKRFANFDGLNLKEYIEDSFRRATTNIDVRDGIEDWQATIHDPFTRNKINAILGKIVSVLPGTEVHPRGDEDIRKSQIITSLLEFNEEVEDSEEFIVTYLSEAITKGTAIGYVGHEFKKEKKRYVSKSGDDIEVKEGVSITNRVTYKVIKLEDFYPSSVGVRNIKEMPFCFVRKDIPFEQFKQEFGMYQKSQLVEPNTTVYNNLEDKPYYLDYISEDVQEGNVEVIIYYSKKDDEYVILANSVWLNPIKDKTGTEQVSPIPFDHKELPFFDVKFELYDSDFFYGKSLPDKLKNLQDVLNVLTNMLLDQSFLSIFTPILTNGADQFEDDYLRPGRRTPIDTQGLPISQAVMKLDVGTPGGWHQYILDYTRKIMEEASVDKVSQGVAGTGDRTTAQEIRVAADGVAAILGLFGRWIRTALKRKSWLETKTILQVWTDPRYPRIAQITGDNSGEEFNNIFNTFKVKNTTLSSGKRGMRIIDFYRNPEERPTAEQLKMKAALTKLSNNEDVEYMAIDPNYIKDLDLDIKLVPNTKSETNKDMEKALAMEKVKIYLSFFPDLANREELFAQLAEKMGDDPTKVMSDKALEPPPPPGENPMGDQGVSTEPQNALTSNAARSAAGGEMDANNLSQLQNQLG